MPESHQKEKGYGHDAEEPLNDRGSGHDAGEPSKRKWIRTRCRRTVETIGDPDTMPKNCRKEKGIRGHCRRAIEMIEDLDTMAESN